MTTLVRFRRSGDEPAWGVIVYGLVRPVIGDIYGNWRPGRETFPVDALALLPPCEPRQIVGLAYNYTDLVGPRAEYDEPLMFLKALSSLSVDGAAIVLPSGVSKVWGEVEVAFVVRRTARDVRAEDAGDYILGYTVGNDVTAQNVASRDHHLARSKSPRTFCPIASRLVTGIEIGSRRLTTRINGRVTQDGRTSNRIMDDARTLSLVSRFITLEAGDIVLTGTPAGALDSLIAPGDTIEIEVEGLGTVANPVVAAEEIGAAHV